ncbi:hypothetical protein JIN85_12215 [Luteolibacter pohnpeiensis]|uniref:Uncharacterized protein n=1 Tax=Luteolibacter pohnpeiensis TaxID=454153 RepID=A0A934S8H5_9BACT|nr:hypothetical protein [Luteolibacter pohnpeiensis]MBK1883184.1 hypothetical protein [Luteolibacter pohnpeiensis]
MKNSRHLFPVHALKWITLIMLQVVAVIQLHAAETGSEVVFKPKEITPSPLGDFYVGWFHFENHSEKPITFTGFGEPKDGQFEPRFVRFEKQVGGKWVDLHIGYDGAGPVEHSFEPGANGDFWISLDDFAEQDAPLTVRVGLDDGHTSSDITTHWSEPFVLDWKTDRSAGKFAEARAAHIAKLRQAYLEAGFKKELLDGDDFPGRLVQAIINAASTENGPSLKPLKEDLANLTPNLELDGYVDIRLGFNGADGDSQYMGWLSFNPKYKLRKCLDRAKQGHIEINRGEYVLEMEIRDEEPDSEFNDRFHFSLQYIPLPDESSVTEDEARVIFMRMLDVLESQLEPG